MNAILRVSEGICSADSFEDLAAQSLQVLAQVVGATRCFVAVRTNGELRPVARHNVELSGDLSDWPVSRSTLGAVCESSEPILLTDVSALTSVNESMRANQIRSVLCVPLGTSERVAGIVYADRQGQPAQFEQTDLALASAVGQLLVLGIEWFERDRRLNDAVSHSDDQRRVLQDQLIRDHQIVGKAKSLTDAYQLLSRVALRRLPVLIHGETGTGKDLFAKAVHRLSDRADEVFIPVNIASFSDSLIESELFGHEAASFTGAAKRRIGRFELAHRGTLFLDEVAEIPPNVQPKLLRFLESGEFERVGGSKPVRVDVRIVCATHQDLQQMVAEGTFREDLYFRLRGVTIEIPPLRERTEDIPLLLDHFLTRIAPEKSFSSPAIRMLQQYHWPGNVRQLMRVVEEMEAISPATEFGMMDVPGHLLGSQTSAWDRFPTLKEVLADAERTHMQKALVEADGQHNKAIELLAMSRATYFERKKKYGLE